MKITFKELEACHTEATVVIDEASWKSAQEATFKKLAKNVQVDGFRKGNAPEALVRKHIDQGRLLEDAVNSLLPDAYKEALKQGKLEPFSQPKVEITKISDTNLEVKFVIVTAPKVELGQYKGLELGKKEAKVTAKEVTEALEDLRKQNASLILKDGAAEKGDTVVLDFVGSVDGVAFEGGTAQNYELELGSGSFIPGFEDQLIGIKAEEHRDINVTFPEQYTKELAGKKAVFACDVHEVKTRKLPELNDEFVKDLALEGIETLEALKESKKKEILANKEVSAKREYLEKLYAEIAKSSKILIPQEMIDDQAQSMKKDMENRMKQSGLTLEQYLQFVGQTMEQFDNKLKEDAKKDITNYFVLEKVGEIEKLELTDADIEAEYAKLAEQYKMKVEDVKKALSAQLDQFKHNLRMTRVEEHLLNLNK